MSICSEPTPFETLVALWTGELTAERALEVEEHLFTCDHCAAASDRLAALVAGLREAIPPVISHAQRDRLVAQGTRVRHTPVRLGVSATAVFASDVDLLVHVLAADLSRADRVDVELVTPDGVSRMAFEHVPFDASAGEILIACQRHYQGMFPAEPFFRVHAVEAGERRRVGDYRVHHVWP